MSEDFESPPSNVGRGRLLILLAALLWSLAGVFIKFLDVPPLTIVFYRSFFAFLVFTAFVRRAEWQINGPVLVSVLTYTAAISSFVSANKLTTAANAIVLQYTAPIFVFLFSRLVLGEKISRVNGFALVAGMIGVGAISLDSAGEPEMAGVALALLSGVLFAAYMINLRRTQQVSPIYLTWVNNAFCALALLFVVSSQLTLSLNQRHSRSDGRSAARFALLSFFQGLAERVFVGSVADRVDRTGAQSGLGCFDRGRNSLDGDPQRRSHDSLRTRRALSLAAAEKARGEGKLVVTGRLLIPRFEHCRDGGSFPFPRAAKS